MVSLYSRVNRRLTSSLRFKKLWVRLHLFNRNSLLRILDSSASSFQMSPNLRLLRKSMPENFLRKVLTSCRDFSRWILMNVWRLNRLWCIPTSMVFELLQKRNSSWKIKRKVLSVSKAQLIQGVPELWAETVINQGQEVDLEITNSLRAPLFKTQSGSTLSKTIQSKTLKTNQGLLAARLTKKLKW